MDPCNDPQPVCTTREWCDGCGGELYKFNGEPDLCDPCLAKAEAAREAEAEKKKAAAEKKKAEKDKEEKKAEKAGTVTSTTGSASTVGTTGTTQTFTSGTHTLVSGEAKKK